MVQKKTNQQENKEAGMSREQVRAFLAMNKEVTHTQTLVRVLGKDIFAMVDGMKKTAAADVLGRRLIGNIEGLYIMADCLDCEDCEECRECAMDMLDELDRLRTVIVMAYDNGLVEDELGMRIVATLENLQNELEG